MTIFMMILSMMINSSIAYAHHVPPNLENPSSQIQPIYSRMTRANQEMGNLWERLGNCSTTLTAVTYNLGLLHVLGGLVDVPYYTQRQKWLAPVLDRFIQNEDPDVLFFQELWYESDFNTLLEVARTHGYVAAIKSFQKIKGRNPLSFPQGFGLQVLVKRDILANGSDFSWIKLELYPAKQPWYEIGVKTRRGLLYGRIDLAGGEQVIVANTHLSARKSNQSSRDDQMAKIIDLLFAHKEDVDYVIIGTDMNLSPELGITQGQNPVILDGWKENIGLYAHFYKQLESHFSYGVDTFRAANQNSGFTQDAEYNVVASQGMTTQDEPNQRLDFVWAATTAENHGLYVSHSKLTLDHSIRRILAHGGFWGFTDYEDAYFTLSDHFGVLSRLELFSIGQLGKTQTRQCPVKPFSRFTP